MGLHGPAILCLETNRARLAVSQRLHHSGVYDLVTATNTTSALVALKANPRIEAAVVSMPDVAAEQHVEIAAKLESVKPGIPTLVVAPLAPEPPALNALHLRYVHSLDALMVTLEEALMTKRWTACTRRDAAALRDDSRHVREEARKLIRQGYERCKGLG
jgi:hypothetical protein